MMTNFGERVRELRKKQGWNQTELAERAGISQSYIARLENSKKSSPSRPKMEAIAHALDVSVGVLFGETQAPGEAAPTPSPAHSPKAEPTISDRIAALPLSDQSLVLRMIEGLEAANRQRKGR